MSYQNILMVALLGFQRAAGQRQMTQVVIGDTEKGDPLNTLMDAKADWKVKLG